MRPGTQPSGPAAGLATSAAAIDVARVASLLAAMDQGRDPPADVADAATGIAEGMAFQDEINRLRLARGERPVGFKIGFTNRTIWDRYGVYAPIWAPVWDTTVVKVSGSATPTAPACFDAGVIAARLNRPRLEPEIVLGLRTIPSSDPSDLAAVASAVEWVAHGFELVQCPWPEWRFRAAQAIASQSLHGALLVGPSRRVTDPGSLAAALADLEIDLACDGEIVAHGHGRDVLDGPVNALAQWLVAAAAAPTVVRPADGMLVTTGTLTDAQTVNPGARWQTHLLDPAGALGRCLEAPLVGLDVRFGDEPPDRR